MCLHAFARLNAFEIADLNDNGVSNVWSSISVLVIIEGYYVKLAYIPCSKAGAMVTVATAVSIQTRSPRASASPE